MKHVIIYTDGAAKGNPGPGGYGVVLLYNSKRKELSGGFRRTTNNRMELLGVLTGLRALKEPCMVTIYTDSKYIVDAVNQRWLFAWKRMNWIRKGNNPVMNVDMWEEIYDQLQTHDITFKWVKGHADNKENERCDELASKAALGKKLKVDSNYEDGTC
ncbi:MAG: ribonuclease HI [FCB group bacterium]|nr:ribonuclease HI [FCB group bacterium]